MKRHHQQPKSRCALPAPTHKEMTAMQRLTTFLKALGTNGQMSGLLFLGPFLDPVPPTLPNPFCNAYLIGLAWIGGIVGLAVLFYGAMLVLRHFSGHMGGDLTKGAMSIIGGLFILGLLMNNGQGLTAVANAAGFSGFTLGCAAH